MSKYDHASLQLEHLPEAEEVSDLLLTCTGPDVFDLGPSISKIRLDVVRNAGDVHEQ